jgi:hypothetical protein
MPSPFPGMNPYLEHPDAWSDFHERYVITLAREIGRAIPRTYFVKVDQNVYAQDAGRELALIGRGDAFAVESGDPSETRPSPPSAALTPASGTVTFAEQLSFEESFIEIRDGESRKVITLIELLSPTNKRTGKKREQFLGKRRAIVASDTNYVELDLLRGFPRLPLRKLGTCDYYALVSRASTRPDADIWSISLRDKLPVIPVPLRDEGEFTSLALQPTLHEVYDDGTYDRYIYKHELRPPLPAEDAAWARATAGLA